MSAESKLRADFEVQLVRICQDCYSCPASVIYGLGHARCAPCSGEFDAANRAKRAAQEAIFQARFAVRDCTGGDCGFTECEDCCPHDEHDHGTCLDCGMDRTDDLVGMAESYYEGDR